MWMGMTVRPSLGGGLASRRCEVARWLNSRLSRSIPQTRYPLLRCLTRLWQAHDERRSTFSRDVLRRLCHNLDRAVRSQLTLLPLAQL